MQTPIFNYRNWDAEGEHTLPTDIQAPFIDEHAALIAASVVMQFTGI